MSQNKGLSENRQININDVPDVVLEYILCQLPAYEDLLNCKMVNRLWYRCVHSVVKKSKRDFKASLKKSTLHWVNYSSDSGPNISGRYSHSCCVYRHLMFIFGGCTSANTTFNDLWTFDLSTRVWIRPLVTGSYPPPKACASLIHYKDNLVLFGGWAHSSSYPLHQDWKLFNQVHAYDIRSSRWTVLTCTPIIPSVAGHTASVIGDKMIVFGGLINDVNSNAFVPTNDVWILTLDSLTWQKVAISQPAPSPRYGHSQVLIDEQHILICGGCGGPNKLLSDMWLLVMKEEWTWIQLDVRSDEDGAVPVIGLHQACKVDEYIVFLNRSLPHRTIEASKETLLGKNIERHQCSQQNGRYNQQKLLPQTTKQERKLRLFEGSTKPSVRPNARLDRAKQMQLLNKMEERIKEIRSSNTIRIPTVQCSSRSSSCYMSLFVLDISNVKTDRCVKWLPQEKEKGPEEKILYSLVAGSCELIMFGGVQKLKSGVDIKSTTTEVVSNTIHIACSKPAII